MSPAELPVLAAGAVCWRVVDGKTKVLVVHRAAHADVSLPKGKLDPGETLPQTAAREILEETGLAVTLGVPLGTVEYSLPSGREKVVYYWAAEVDENTNARSTFSPNDEIAAIEWLSLPKARKKLDYPHDVDVLDRFEALLGADHARTFAIMVLRHGTAVPVSSWDGPDSTRPLLHRGTEQAVGIAPALAAFAPTKLLSSTATRCLATIAPLAELTGHTVKASATLSQDAFESGRSDLDPLVARRLKKRESAVMCSHGPVIPQLIARFASRSDRGMDDGLRTASSLETGDVAILHFSRETDAAELVAVETHSPA